MESKISLGVNPKFNHNDMTSTHEADEAVAIIGMGCQFPGGVKDPDEFWKLMIHKKDAIVDVPKERWDLRRFYHSDHDQPGKMHVKAGGFLQRNIEDFDALFFGITPREAECMDPQQRLLLEVAWEALEDAGIDHVRLAGSDTGVYIGGFTLDNKLTQMSGVNRDRIGPHTAVGSTMTLLSNRLSYVFDLHGPSLSVDTACSSSLVAFHYACEAIRKGDCSMALTGGVNVIHRPEYMIAMCKGQFLSPDGHCKSFDARADGYARGEGAGIVVLKALSHAIEDGDRIHAIVRGSGVNQDGRTNGLTVPNGDAQEALIRTVCRKAAINPHAIGYVEAHGTGTPIGDPTEAKALGKALGQGRGPDKACIIGSVKSNIGHLEAASGIAGIIKAVLCLQHEQIPPLATLLQPNPAIPFNDLGLRLPTDIEPLPKPQGKAYTAVNSFGYGGTNAHALLEKAPDCPSRCQPARTPIQGHWLLPLSAHSESALKSVAQKITEHIENDPQLDLSSLCYSASVRRSHLDHRLAIVFSTREQLLEQLNLFIKDQPSDLYFTGKTRAGVENNQPVWVFTGMGPQWWGMGRELLKHNDVFRQAAEACDRLFIAETGWSILEEMSRDESESRVGETHIAQPANFVIQAGLLAILDDWGLQPGAIVGHSVGEVSAAYASGMLSLEDAIKVSSHRGRIQAKALGKGKMLAVGLTEEEAVKRLAQYPGKVSVAAVNSFSSLTLSGDAEALEAMAAQLETEGIFNRFLRVEVPYHSPAMDALKPELREALADLDLQPLRYPLYSTVTGERVKGPSFDAEYWCDNVREPVLFASALENIVSDEHQLFLEVGPHPVLSSSIKETLMRRGIKAPVIATLRRQLPEQLGLLSALASLYVEGTRLDWKRIYPEGEFTPLPHYPWERQRYWSESNQALVDRLGTDSHPLLAQRLPAPNPVWESTLNSGMLPYLEDHQVDGVVVLPGAAYVETALALGHVFQGHTVQTVTGLTFHNALVIDKLDEPILRVEYCEQSGMFNLYSRGREEQSPWMQHASGELWRGDRPLPPDIAIHAIAKRCKESLPVDRFYQDLRQRGLVYGPWFQGIHSLAKGDNEVLAAIQAHPGCLTASKHYLLHPTLLDTCFQALIGLLEDKNQAAFLPVEIERITLYERPPARFWVHGRLLSHSPRSIEGDLILFSDDGTCIAEVQGLKCRALESAPTPIDAYADKCMYQYEWQMAPVESLPQRTGNWMVVNDDKRLNIGARLAQAIGGKLIQVKAGELYSASSDNQVVIDPDKAEHWIQLLRDGTDINGIVYLCDHRDPSEEVAKQVIQETTRLLHLINAAATHGGEITPRLFMLTRGAQKVVATDRLSAPSQWGSIGLARVAGNEYRELGCTLLDLSSQPDAAEMASLIDEFISNHKEDDVALRGPLRFVHRLQKTPLAALKHTHPNRPPQHISSNRGYRVVREEEEVFLQAYKRTPPAADELEIEIRSISLPGVSPNKTIRHSAEQSFLRGFSGIVSRVGDGVFDFKAGDTVTGCAEIGLGSFETLKTQKFLSTIPKNVDLMHATVMAEVYVPLIHGLKHLAGVKQGETVLIHGARDRYVTAASQLAAAMGADVLIASNDRLDEEQLDTLDCCAWLNPCSVNFADQVGELTDHQGVDVLVDFEKPDSATHVYRSMAPFGRIVNLNGSVNGQVALPHNVNYSQIDISEWIRLHPEECSRLCAEAYSLLEKKRLKPHGIRSFRSQQLEEAKATRKEGLEPENRILTFRDQLTVPVRSDSEDLPFITDQGSYLITGGFGGFGSRVAHWLADQGVRHLVLVGRRGANTEEGQQLIHELEQKGAKVLSMAADVTRLEDVNKILECIESHSAPLHAVFHSAGTLDDAPLAELNRKRLEKVIAPKVQGAWNLHVATKKMALKHFILFSSVSSLIGNSRQGNYVAANTFLDNLAHYRQEAGLAALSVNWGAIADAGMAADSAEVKRHLELMGMQALSADQAMKTLHRIANFQPVQLGIMDVSWSRWAQYEPAGGASPRFCHLVESEADSQSGQKSHSLRRQLATMDQTARKDVLVLMLCEQISETMRLPKEVFDPQRPLTEIGIDSLIGVELQSALNITFGIELSALELIKGNSTMQIADLILRKFNFQDTTEAASRVERPERQTGPADIESLNEGALDKLLEKLTEGVPS